MFSHRIATSIDYNRGLWAPIRWLHAAWAVLGPVLDALLGWILLPACRAWAPLLLFTIVAVIILLPDDPRLSEQAQAFFGRGGGDLRRELEAIQQFGQGASMALISLAIFLLDQRRRRRLLDWGLAALVLITLCTLVKGLAGRPRPRLDDPFGFIGPLDLYPVLEGGRITLESAWSSSSALASFPSRHSAFATLAAFFLTALYPRLWPLVWPIAVVVCLARVLTGAHFPTDIIAGAALGLLVSRLVVEHYLGVRLLDWIWVRLVDRQAMPALPRVLEAESAPS